MVSKEYITDIDDQNLRANATHGNPPDTHFSSGSREQAPLWSEKHSHSYGLSKEQTYGHEDSPEP